MDYENILAINQENINIIKKYGPVFYLLIEYVRDNDFQKIPNKSGEMVDSYECSDEEIVDYLVNNPKILERLKLNKKNRCDTLIICCEYLDNELIKLLLNDNKKIILYGVLKNNVDKILLENLLSKSNCYYRSDRVIDGSLLYFFNKNNNFIRFDSTFVYRIYVSDSMNDFDKIIEEILRFISKNNLDKIDLSIHINNPKIITDFMPSVEKKLSSMNIKCNIRYDLTKDAAVKMSENYSYYLNKQVLNDGVNSFICSEENMNFGSIDDYVDFSRMIDIIMTRIPNEASELDKVVYVSQFVINYMDCVDHIEEDDPYTILKRGTGVCRDYAQITSYLLGKLGIDCKTVSSLNTDRIDMNAPATEHTGGGHEFNVVSIDGINYFMDNTWEKDSLLLWKSGYFLVSKELFKESHSQYPAVDNYDCPKSYPSDKIRESLTRVLDFEKNYTISNEQLSKLLNQERYANIEYALKGNKVNRSM